MFPAWRPCRVFVRRRIPHLQIDKPDFVLATVHCSFFEILNIANYRKLGNKILQTTLVIYRYPGRMCRNKNTHHNTCIFRAVGLAAQLLRLEHWQHVVMCADSRKPLKTFPSDYRYTIDLPNDSLLYQCSMLLRSQARSLSSQSIKYLSVDGRCRKETASLWHD